MILDTTNLQQMFIFTKFIIYQILISKHTLIFVKTFKKWEKIFAVNLTAILKQK
jgi:hypothetical protein